MRRLLMTCLAAAFCSQAFISIAAGDAPDSLRRLQKRDSLQQSMVTSTSTQGILVSTESLGIPASSKTRKGMSGKAARQRRNQMKLQQKQENKDSTDGPGPAALKAQADTTAATAATATAATTATKAKPSASDANNPLANFKSVSIHNIFTPSLYGAEGMTDVSWKRYAQPIGRVLIRASLPVVTVAEGTKAVSGLGELNIFATWIATKPTARNQFGFGPLVTFPTSTDSRLGTGKWQAGLAIVGYFPLNENYQMGILATWQHSFAGKKDRKKVHMASFQPMNIWQIGNGAYLRSTGIILLDFENKNYYIPFGLGVGKVFQAGKATFNIFAEPQYTVWHTGTAIPKIQLFVGVNTQF